MKTLLCKTCGRLVAYGIVGPTEPWNAAWYHVETGSEAHPEERESWCRSGINGWELVRPAQP